MNTPAVFSNIVLSRDWGLGPDAFLRKIRIYLERSQSTPIYVDLDLYFADSLETTQAILAAIAPHIERCYSLHISVPRPEWLDLIQHLFGDSFGQQIESMSLRFRPTVPWAAASTTSEPPILSGILPSLTSLTLEGLSLSIIQASLPGLRKFEYKQLEETYAHPTGPSHATSTPLQSFLDVLRSAETLQELRIEQCAFVVEDEDMMYDPERPAVTLPHLQSLCFAHVDPAYITLLLESIEAPTLRNLTLRCDSMRHTQDIWWFPQRTTFSSIRSLEIEGYRIMDSTPLAGFLRMLAQLPGLTRLNITAPYSANSTSRFFDVMATASTSQQWLCPHVTEVILDACHGITGSEIHKFARARSSNARVSSVRRLVIQNCPSFDPFFVDELKEVVDHVEYLPLPHGFPLVVPASPMQWGNAVPVFLT